MDDDTAVLLHTCCGPCASASHERLISEGYRTVLYYSNSNICSHAEYEKRLESVLILADQTGSELMVDPYDHEAWLESVEGFEAEPEGGRRCSLCFRFSLSRTFIKAQELGLRLFTTTLTISPHKNSKLIFSIGREIAAQPDLQSGEPGKQDRQPSVPSTVNKQDSRGGHRRKPAIDQRHSPACSPLFLEIDFKKQGGFRRSVELSKEYRLYRQSFCGCEFSLR